MSGESILRADLVLLQDLTPSERLLVIALMAQGRSSEGSFSTADVRLLERSLRLPPIANVSATLARLRDRTLVVRLTQAGWALTPRGEAQAEALVPAPLAGVQQTPPGAAVASSLGDLRHSVIPPAFGPPGTGTGLESLLEESAFESNVMLITRFPKAPEDHFAQLIPVLRSAVSLHGLHLWVASDGNAEDQLWPNVVTYMWACKYAIVLMDSTDGVLNSNVLIEIGGMLMTGRRCAVLRDLTTAVLPSDLVGHIYKQCDLNNMGSTADIVHRWIREDLRLGECAECPPRT